MSSQRTRQPGPALRGALNNLLLLVGAALPFVLALVLVGVLADSGDDRDDASDRDGGPLVQETVTVPFDREATVRTANTYQGRVRLVISGSAAGSDAFYRYTDDEGRPLDAPQLDDAALEIDGQRALTALGLGDNPPPYADDHVYRLTYEAGPEPRRIPVRLAARFQDGASGAYTIQVIQLE